MEVVKLEIRNKKDVVPFRTMVYHLDIFIGQIYMIKIFINTKNLCENVSEFNPFIS